MALSVFPRLAPFAARFALSAALPPSVIWRRNSANYRPLPRCDARPPASPPQILHIIHISISATPAAQLQFRHSITISSFATPVSPVALRALRLSASRPFSRCNYRPRAASYIKTRQLSPPNFYMHIVPHLTPRKHPRTWKHINHSSALLHPELLRCYFSHVPIL